MNSSNANYDRKEYMKYYSRIMVAFVVMATLLFVIFGVLFNVSRKNVLSIGHLSAVKMSQSLEYYLIEEVDEIALAAKTVEVMQNEGNSKKVSGTCVTYYNSEIDGEI